jgi:hypothetical protein
MKCGCMRARVPCRPSLRLRGHTICTHEKLIDVEWRGSRWSALHLTFEVRARAPARAVLAFRLLRLGVDPEPDRSPRSYESDFVGATPRLMRLTRVSDARTRLLGTTSRCRPTSRGDSSDERNEHRISRAGVEESGSDSGRRVDSSYTRPKSNVTRASVVRGRDESDQL